jgi:GTP-binding protein
LVLIMDARRPFTELDLEMLEWFAPTGKPIHCLLSKADKLNRNEQSDAIRLARTVLASYVDEHGKPLPFSVQLFSALKRIGLDEADRKICSLLQLETSLDQDEPPAQEEKNPGEREVPPGSKH